MMGVGVVGAEVGVGAVITFEAMEVGTVLRVRRASRRFMREEAEGEAAAETVKGSTEAAEGSRTKPRRSLHRR